MNIIALTPFAKIAVAAIAIILLLNLAIVLGMVYFYFFEKNIETQFDNE